MYTSDAPFSVVDGAVGPVGDVDLDAGETAELLEVVERSAERLRPRLAVLTAPEGVGHLEQPQLAQPRPGVVLEGLADAVVAVGVLQLAGVEGQGSGEIVQTQPIKDTRHFFTETIMLFFQKVA